MPQYTRCSLDGHTSIIRVASVGHGETWWSGWLSLRGWNGRGGQLVAVAIAVVGVSLENSA